MQEAYLTEKAVPIIKGTAFLCVGCPIRTALNGRLRFSIIQLQRLAPRGHKPIRQEGKRTTFPPARLMPVGADQGAFALASSSSSGQRLADFGLPPCDKSTSTHVVRCVSFISYESPPIRTALNGRLRFFSIIQLQRLAPRGHKPIRQEG
jgi:hypothetical protein